jgi:hypothetical protein
MDPSRHHTSDPVQGLIRIMQRTLWMLYAGFWFSIILYAVVLIALPAITGSAAPGSDRIVRELPANWGQWQFLFGVIGVVSLYVSLRLRHGLLSPERIRRGASNIYGLAAALDEGTDTLTRALQDLLGRLTMRYVILWMIVEIPAILGVVDRLISGNLRVFVGLALLSAMGLFIHRPSRNRTAEVLGPMAR